MLLLLVLLLVLLQPSLPPAPSPPSDRERGGSSLCPRRNFLVPCRRSSPLYQPTVLRVCSAAGCGQSGALGPRFHSAKPSWPLHPANGPAPGPGIAPECVCPALEVLPPGTGGLPFPATAVWGQARACPALDDAEGAVIVSARPATTRPPATRPRAGLWRVWGLCVCRCGRPCWWPVERRRRRRSHGGREKPRVSAGTRQEIAPIFFPK